MSEAIRASVAQWKIAAQWLERADGDLRIAEATLALDVDTIWGAAFHCQQAQEKMAKAVLIALGIEPPKIHDIEVLAQIVGRWHGALGGQIRDLAVLTTWYFAARYPGGLGDSLPSPDQVETTLDKLSKLRRQIDSLAPKV